MVESDRCVDKVQATGCQFTFSARINETGAVWVVLHTFSGEPQICPDIAVPLGISAGVLFLVLLIGLITILVYKCYIVVVDR